MNAFITSVFGVAPKARRRNLLNYSTKQQQYNFLRNLFLSAQEHSKRLTIIDTIVYLILMTILFGLVIFMPHIADQVVDMVGYTTTTYVALRASYSIKAAVENYQKLRKQFKQNEEEIEEEEFFDGDSLG